MSSSAKPSPDSVNIRLITENDLDEACQLIQTEDWFITIEKMHLTFSEGIVTYYILEYVKDRQILGVMNITSSRPNERSLGNVIMRPGFRGQGLGTYFMRHVFEQYPNTIVTFFSQADLFYKNLGANTTGEIGVYVEIVMDREIVNNYCSENIPFGVSTSSFNNARLEDLRQYDTEARGYNSPYLTVVTRTCDHTILAVRETDKKILGYAGSWDDKGFLRFNGFYADDDHIAAMLLRETLKKYPSLNVLKYFTMDGNQFLLKFGKPNVEILETRFGYGGVPAKIPVKKLYAITEPDMSY